MKTPSRHSGFTLIEMLVVISIIGILVAIALPTLNNLGKADSVLASTRQMLDDVARARQYAISQRTTVYMIFCPSNFWNDPNYGRLSDARTPNEYAKAQKLYGKQLNSYTFVTLRSVGEQPGESSPRYLQSWKTLPEGAIIADWKFRLRTAPPKVVTDPSDINRAFTVYGFSRTTKIPFPSADAQAIGEPYVSVPYIAFNYLGQPAKDGVRPSNDIDERDGEYIPLARGSMSYSRDANKVATQANPIPAENPPGISTNAFTIVHIDRLTGRARLEKQEFK